MIDRDLRLDEEEEADDGIRRDLTFMERRLLEARTLLLCGPVTDRMHRDAAARLMVLEELGPDKPVTIVINSPGGSADSGFALFDLIRFVSCPVNTVVNGLCASAGILISLATEKDRRFCMRESRFMVHQPSTMGRGTASDLDITAKEVIKLRERYIKIIADATAQSYDKILADAERDFWLNAGEALEYGMVGKVLAHRDEMRTD